MQETIDLLSANLATDADAKGWARHQVDNFAELEAARKSLCTHLYGIVDRNEVIKDVESLCNVVRLCLIYDRANACLNMKLARDDPVCPSGFLWINRVDIGMIPAVTWKHSVSGDIVTQTNSINKRYALLLDPARFEDGKVPERLADIVSSLSVPMAPRWMVEEKMANLPIFE